MANPLFALLIRHWRQWPEQRRAPLLATVVALTVLVLWQGVWQPGRERVLMAEQRHGRELALADAISQVAPIVSEVSMSAQALSPAELNDSARAAGLELQGLDLKQGQMSLSVQGPPTSLVQWLHHIEVRGGQFLSLSLQSAGTGLQARLTLQVPGA